MVVTSQMQRAPGISRPHSRSPSDIPNVRKPNRVVPLRAMHAMAVIGDVPLYYRCNCAGNAKLSRYAREQRFIACATGARPRCMGIDFGYGRALDRQQRIDLAVPLSNTASPMADPRPTSANHRWNAMTGLAENARLPPWPPPMHGSEAVSALALRFCPCFAASRATDCGFSRPRDLSGQPSSPRTPPSHPCTTADLGAWRGGRVVDCTALEMRHRCKPIGGSNPPLSAICV